MQTATLMIENKDELKSRTLIIKMSLQWLLIN